MPDGGDDEDVALEPHADEDNGTDAGQSSRVTLDPLQEKNGEREEKVEEQDNKAYLCPRLIKQSDDEKTGLLREIAIPNR